MSESKPVSEWTVQAFIEHLASCSENVAFCAGTDGRSTAGAIVSYLADQPQHLEAFMHEGIWALPDDWLLGGRLTWRASNGQIVHPSQLPSHNTGHSLSQPSETVQ